MSVDYNKYLLSTYCAQGFELDLENIRNTGLTPDDCTIEQRKEKFKKSYIIR